MKRNLSILALAIVFAGCEPSHVNDNLYDPAVYFLKSGLQRTETMYDLEDHHSYQLSICCGGFEEQSPVVNVNVDSGVLNSYNTAHGTGYRQLPDNCYSFVGGEKQLMERKAGYEIVFDCKKLLELCPEGDYSALSEYVVPVALSSKSASANNGKVELTEALITPVMSKMGFKTNLYGDIDMSISEMEDDDNFIYLKYKLTTPVENRWECPIVFSFNEPATGLSYPQLPAGSFTVSASSDGFKPGVSEVIYTVRIDKSKTPEVYYSLVSDIKSGGDFLVLNESKANISLLNRKKYPQANLAVEYFNSGESASSADYMLDGDPNTWWHPAYKAGQYGSYGAIDFIIVLRLDEQLPLSAFSILRSNNVYKTDLKAGYIELSTDGTNFSKASDFYFGTAAEYPDSGPLFVLCEPTTAKYVKIVCTECNRYASGVNHLANIAEFNVFYK